MSTTSAPPPAFAGVTSKRLVSLGKSLVKLSSAYAIENRLEKAFGDWEVGLRGLWHLVRHDAVDCDKNLQLLVVLRDDTKRSPVSEDRLEALEHVLRSITTTRPENYHSYMEGVPILMFELAEYLYTHAPERARALYPATQPNVQSALALIMVFHGEPLSSDAAEQLTAALVSSVGAPRPADERFDVDRIVEQLGTVAMFERAACDVLRDEERSLVTPQGHRGGWRCSPTSSWPAAIVAASSSLGCSPGSRSTLASRRRAPPTRATSSSSSGSRTRA
ncbi:MAG: hypothetical protein R6X02_21160 [Enhygromyxa sp.]